MRWWETATRIGYYVVLAWAVAYLLYGIVTADRLMVALVTVAVVLCAVIILCLDRRR